ncbi:class I tRNA ligase family protein, partial [candidate division WWE3 bacterium]|nr:class I tRNA ligase family protein [candidate division WWE3 bacterium]
PDVEVTFIVDGATVHDRYSEARKEYSFEHISKGLQEIVAPIGTKYYLDAKDAPSDYVLQETDTFDTWFSSGQWPLTTLGYPDSDDFKYFYPTSVIDTMWDILPFWIMRMLMFGLYLTDKVPFEKVHMHSRVVDSKGQKMSKSKGNVVNPMELVEKYGADALRFALVFGVAPASDIPLGEEKMIGGRNLITKIWNIARFILAIDPETANKEGKDDAELKELINQTIGETEKNIEAFQFGIASENLYHVIWDQFASVYLERYKEGEVSYKALTDSFGALLKLLHPFIPFITEELFAKLPGNENRSASLENWPTPLP